MKPSEWIHNRAKEMASKFCVNGRAPRDPAFYYGLATLDFNLWQKEEREKPLEQCPVCRYYDCTCKGEKIQITPVDK